MPWSKTTTFDVEPLDTDPPEQKLAKAANANPLKNKMPSQKDTLEGLWRVKSVASHEAGPDKDPQAVFGALVHVEGDKANLLCGRIDEDGIKKWTLKVLPGQVPQRFELTREGVPLPGKYAPLPDTLPGTYEIVDDVLRIGLRIGSLGVFRGPSSAAVKEQTLVVELDRVDAEYAEVVMALQGLWGIGKLGALGSSGNNETFVLVEGEGVREISKGEFGDWAALRLLGRAKPGDAEALSEVAKAFSLGDVSDAREVTLFPPSPTDKGVDGLFARMDDGRMLFCYKEFPGALLWERATREDLAAAGLKRVMSTTWLLAQKKLSLQEFVAKYPDTQAAAEARQELDRMPSDKEIAELDAAKYLKQARGFLGRREPLRAKQQMQLIIDKYPNTEAAKEAKEEIERLPPDDEAREIEAATYLKRALKTRRSLSQASVAINQGERDRRLRVLMRYYPGTEAAAEAERLLDPKAQREERATHALIPAKNVFSTNPEAGKKWLRKVEAEYPGTKAAEEATRLLEETR